MMLDEEIDDKKFLEMYGLPHEDQEDPYKKYPQHLHRGTVRYVTDRQGTNYYLDFKPDPIIEQGPERGTVAWYKKQKFGWLYSPDITKPFKPINQQISNCNQVNLF